MRELEKRGRHERESGAFLLAGKRPIPGRVQKVVYFDDLEPESLTGIVELSSSAFTELWRICRDEGLVVVGDIHTHPTEWVGQSRTDQENPMIARPGHIALIAPRFAQGRCRPSDIGVHEYLGSAGWRSAEKSDSTHVVYVGWRP